ncbi:MAG: hypothetical protein RL557_1083 [archaeon]|jgi:hypothetical protein
MHASLTGKKAQIWGLDLIIAVFIFSIGIVVFLVYSINYSGEAADTFEKIRYDGEIIMDTLLSDGSPQDWNSTNVVKIGLLSEHTINETKLQYFYALSQTQYVFTQSLFNTRYQYYFFLSEPMEISGVPVVGIGNATIDNSNNLIRITRFAIYRDKPVTVYLYLGE